MPAPYQVRFSEYLKKYFETLFLFYESIPNDRPNWWKIPLPQHCKILNHSYFKNRRRYFSFEVKRWLESFNPDILMIGDFYYISNYLAYRWALKKNKKIIIFSETLRTQGKQRERSCFTKTIDYLYKDADLVFANSNDTVKQFNNIFSYLSAKTVAARYASDIDNYLTHPLREQKKSYVYFFPNRLIHDYNPLGAIEIFYEILKKYPGSKLHMNSDGELREECDLLIARLNIEDQVEFITEKINNWGDLHKLYRVCDILIFPARFSNGNFTTIECMASGLGIIISDQIRGQANHLVVNGENGFVCPVEKGAFVEAINKYIQRPELLKIHAKKNKRIVQPLSLEGTAELYNNLIFKHLYSENDG